MTREEAGLLCRATEVAVCNYGVSGGKRAWQMEEGTETALPCPQYLNQLLQGSRAIFPHHSLQGCPCPSTSLWRARL